MMGHSFICMYNPKYLKRRRSGKSRMVLGVLEMKDLKMREGVVDERGVGVVVVLG